jgi:hypothetical protein
LQSIRAISNGDSGKGDAGNDDERGDASRDPFEEKFGWLIHAERFAEYNRCTLNQAFELPCREFINALTYLQGKSEWDIRRAKKQNS